jgi:hypothetical protein
MAFRKVNSIHAVNCGLGKRELVEAAGLLWSMADARSGPGHHCRIAGPECPRACRAGGAARRIDACTRAWRHWSSGSPSLGWRGGRQSTTKRACNTLTLCVQRAYERCPDRGYRLRCVAVQHVPQPPISTRLLVSPPNLARGWGVSRSLDDHGSSIDAGLHLRRIPSEATAQAGAAGSRPDPNARVILLQCMECEQRTTPQ